jgi:hypothetical protein
MESDGPAAACKDAVKPGDVSTHEALGVKIRGIGRVDNFGVTDDRREKTKGSGQWRGKFRCSGSNTKQEHAQKRHKRLFPCTFCVPYTYTGERDAVVVKDHCTVDAPDGTESRVKQEFSLLHNHVMHGVLTVMSAMGELVMVKSLDQHLTDRERAFVGLFAGTHVSVSDIQVKRLQQTAHGR